MNIQNRISLCDGWEFSPVWSDAFLRGEGEAEAVRLPHQVQDLPLHYASTDQYERICGYRKVLRLPESRRQENASFCSLTAQRISHPSS